MGRSIANKIKIICRVRPFHDHEVPDDSIEIDNNGVIVQDQRNPTNLTSFKFTSCYSMKSTQLQIFKQDVQPLIERVFEGYDATIFAYGVTGSGKTYTMEGTENQPGIIPRVAEYLFETKEASHISDVQISMSYMEIFKESVFDLLVSRDKMQRGLDIREGPDREVFVANVTEKQLDTLDEFNDVFSMASKNRSTASTKLNKRSSRSHAILSLHVAITTPINTQVTGTQYRKVLGKINLIDLAGSEDNRKTENKKDRMTESAAINKSLFVLGQVVEALNMGLARIPFRDSKMTRILQPALEGDSLGMMIINIAPGSNYISDTIKTLDFANRSKKIKSRPKPVQRVPSSPSSYDSSSNENESSITRLLKRSFNHESGYDVAKQSRRIRSIPRVPGYSRPTMISETLSNRSANRHKIRSSNSGKSDKLLNKQQHDNDVVVMSRKELNDLLDQKINEALSKHPLLK
ncbi:hypothetical protein INT45_011760 [Circinella minor]|uniref:Kinesin-like protein n=1 Tax=Circinella minor TaxID=1195481 RepID=A0A8H7SCU0_9FUNG|nr:hypothetical protein INT45_011760 [Circinella minor]